MNVSELHKIAEGREAEIFEWEDGTVLRLMRKADAVEPVEMFAAATKAAHAAGVSVPAPYELVTVDGRPGLVMEAVDGPDLLTLIARQPWLIWSVGKVIGRLQAELHDVVAPDTVPNLKETYRWRIDSDKVPPEVVSYAHQLLDDLPDGNRLCHGDLHPANVLKADSAYYIIDWTGAAKGDPMADYARTQLTIQLGEPDAAAPLLIRKLAVLGRGVLLSAFHRGYREHSAPDEELVRRWEVPVMAYRLVDGIEEERPKLLKLLEERLDKGT